MMEIPILDFADSGLATIVDAETVETYNKFYEQWYINYPEKYIR